MPTKLNRYWLQNRWEPIEHDQAGLPSQSTRGSAVCRGGMTRRFMSLANVAGDLTYGGQKLL